MADSVYRMTSDMNPQNNSTPANLSSISMAKKRSWDQVDAEAPGSFLAFDTIDSPAPKRTSIGSPSQPAWSISFMDGPLTVHRLANGVVFATVHQVVCAIAKTDRDHAGHNELNLFYDLPQLKANDNKRSLLRGQHPITWDEEDSDLSDEFRERHPGIDFAIIHNHRCEEYHDSISQSMVQMELPHLEKRFKHEIEGLFCVLKEDGPPSKPFTHAVSIVSSEFHDALITLKAMTPEFFRQMRPGSGFPDPYFKSYDEIYGIKSSMEKIRTKLGHRISASQWLRFHALCEVIAKHNEADFNSADSMFERRMVSRRHFGKLFQPEEVVLRTSRKPVQAFVVKDTMWEPDPPRLTVECWSWEYDGIFKQKTRTFFISPPSAFDKEVPIADLEIFPMRFDTNNHQTRLLECGRMFWSCRLQKFVSYISTNLAVSTHPRYMIDHAMYQRMHEHELGDIGVSAATSEVSQLDLKGHNDPPEEPFLILLPPTVRGYDFHDKKWSYLNVESIRDISWNRNAFDQQLVLKQQKKDLIKALISVHMSGRDSYQRDIIEGKGKGLIILLHGSPGTGKTLTAESIAEYTEKPLYRVTCGDIGTDPDTVEKYLETVLLIGTVWKCVVLLDEADVFLEERTPTDILRNALVSSFLRVLEYFDGILILTSNRIGAFDEAFKSRVQLALHYPPLDESGRWEVWNMFLKAMHGEDVPMEYEGIRSKLESLARHKLNGRQIRNTVNTGRQLARYKNEHLAYSHFDQAIEVLNEFEQCVRSVNGHTDDEFAHATGKRAHFV